MYPITTPIKYAKKIPGIFSMLRASPNGVKGIAIPIAEIITVAIPSCHEDLDWIKGNFGVRIQWTIKVFENIILLPYVFTWVTSPSTNQAAWNNAWFVGVCIP